MNGAAAALAPRLRETTRARMKHCLAASLEAVHEDLHDLARRSTTRDEHRLIAQAVDLAQQSRTQIAAAFERHLVALFDARMTGAGDASAAAAASTSLSQLVLVDDAVIEHQIALGKLVRKTLDEIDLEQLVALETRLGQLAGGDSLTGSANPVGPDTIFEALQRACAQIEVGDAVRMTLINGLQPRFAAALPKLYDELNGLLIGEGVAPTIRHTIQRSSASASTTAQPATRRSADGMTLSQVMSVRELLPSSASSPLDLGAILAALLEGTAANRQYGARLLADPQGSLYANAMATPTNEVLVASLSQLQGAVTSGPGGAQDLQAVVHHMAKADEHPLDRLTGELVAVVFDFLLADKRLPETVKSEIGRLQIVALKAALIDRSFFARREHPLRRFLDEATVLAGDPSLDTAAESDFVRGLRAIVDELLAGFEADLAVFDAARERVQALAAQASSTREQEMSALKAASLAEERAAQAKVAASALVAQRVGSHTLPFVREFLDDVWTRALAQAGDDAAWDQRVKVMDELLWSLEPKQRSELAQFTAALPRLVGELQRGMRAAGTLPETASAFLADLMKAHTAVLQAARGNVAAPPARPRVVAPSAPAVIAPATNETAPGTSETVSGANETAPAMSERVAARAVVDAPALLAVGSIVEFGDVDPPQRARLGWVSPSRTRYVFTSAVGGGRIMTADELSAALAQGHARVTSERASVFGQALAVALGEAEH